MLTQHGVRSVPDRGRSIVFLTGDEGQLIAPARRPHQGGDRDKNGGRHDAGGHETGWRRAECGIEPAALAKAKLHLRSYFLRMRRNTYGLAHGLRDRFMDRRHTRRILDYDIAVKVGLAGRWYMVIL